MKRPFEKCPVCGGELVQKEVEKILEGGGNTARMRVKAELCLHCGERFYPPQTVRQFEEIRSRLRSCQTEGFRVSGQAYEVVSDAAEER